MALSCSVPVHLSLSWSWLGLYVCRCYGTDLLGVCASVCHCYGTDLLGESVNLADLATTVRSGAARHEVKLDVWPVVRGVHELRVDEANAFDSSKYSQGTYVGLI